MGVCFLVVSVIVSDLLLSKVFLRHLHGCQHNFWEFDFDQLSVPSFYLFYYSQSYWFPSLWTLLYLNLYNLYHIITAALGSSNLELLSKIKSSICGCLACIKMCETFLVHLNSNKTTFCRKGLIGTSKSETSWFSVCEYYFKLPFICLVKTVKNDKSYNHLAKGRLFSIQSITSDKQFSVSTA